MSDLAVAVAVAGVLDNIEFTHPVEFADVLTVQTAIKAVVPASIRVEAFHRITVVIFELSDRAKPDQVLLRRQLTVTKEQT